MRGKILFAIIAVSIFLNLHNKLFALGNVVSHPAITEKAMDMSILENYLKNQMGFDDGMKTELCWYPPRDIADRMCLIDYLGIICKRTIKEWARIGSNIEDMTQEQARSRHHFHAPISNVGLDNADSGLDNWTDHPHWWGVPTILSCFDLTGESAVVWAIAGVAKKSPTDNPHSWDKTRDFLYLALTEHDKEIRERHLARTFMNLGSILHLLEDMSVPAHTRNDFLFAHYRWVGDYHNYFETWVEEKMIKDKGCSWSGTSPAIFDKVKSYFDAGEYHGDYLYGQLPPDTWGLAECTNYQFLSTSTIFDSGASRYQFPQPDKTHIPSTRLVESEYLGEKLFFDGSNYGVTHIARESYTRWVTLAWCPLDKKVDRTITPDDDYVCEDYANITIPRTIDYTTGLLNYFFRGKLSVENVTYNGTNFVADVRNISKNSNVEQALVGGKFELFWDDAQGNRAKLSEYAVSQLNYDQTMQITFTPQSSAKQYIIVYKGNICANTEDLDSDDENAIATAVFEYESCTTCWPNGIRLTFSGVQLCPGRSWPNGETLNRSFDLIFNIEYQGYCYYSELYSTWGIDVLVRKTDCAMSIFLIDYYPTSYFNAYFDFNISNGYKWADGVGNNRINNSMCGMNVHLDEDYYWWYPVCGYGGNMSWEKNE